ncbi:MAG TPA: amidohydrolase, partial [Bacteroidia bacterium]|nr:amidohydrolase [Bacteroidia bacterium]
KTLVFNAAGYLWKKQLPDGKPVRLTSGKDFEFEPSFSPDGSKITYVTWNDTATGAVMTIPAKTSGQPQKVTMEKGIFRMPSFSPDGKTIVFWKEDGNDHQGYAFCVKPGIYTVLSTGGDATFLFNENAQKPTFSVDGKRIFYYVDNGDSKELKAFDLDKKTHSSIATNQYAWEIVPSPDNKWLAFRELFKVYICAFPQTGKSLETGKDMKSVPESCVTRDAGQSLHWSADSKKLHWTMGDAYFTRSISETFAFVSDGKDSIPGFDTTGIKIGLELPSDKPKGTLAFTNARIITVDATNSVIENGTIVVKENRIIAVGKTGEVQIPADAKVMDCTGKTIMPGMVD